jgi:hypothetical protein
MKAMSVFATEHTQIYHLEEDINKRTAHQYYASHAYTTANFHWRPVQHHPSRHNGDLHD